MQLQVRLKLRVHRPRVQTPTHETPQTSQESRVLLLRPGLSYKALVNVPGAVVPTETPTAEVEQVPVRDTLRPHSGSATPGGRRIW